MALFGDFVSDRGQITNCIPYFVETLCGGDYAGFTDGHDL